MTSPELESSQLYKWLKRKAPDLAGRVSLIRDELRKWLPQIVALFPHYPSHGIDHSDRIVAQLSKLLFVGSTPTIPFSPGEVYCLLCASYLHDMGMVASGQELGATLTSDAWKSFVEKGGKGHAEYQAYQAIRTGPAQKTRDQADFFADIALRQLLAAFVRRDHHERGKTALQLHPFLKQLVDNGDPVAFETISSLGVGHGLPDSELSDEERFPQERDVLGHKVNVNFLARLLRIGDLLDMDSARADPMTLKAAEPLPSSAIPHWKQYSAMKHENISPKVIEFKFECKDQDTHRVLRDWFGWLEAEVKAVGLAQLHSKRHSKWKPPRCTVSSQSVSGPDLKETSPSIIIKPAKDANYTFHDWKLELDQERILDRLIHDVYADSLIFIRELIQNALDATRCQMYNDFRIQNPGEAPPDRPTQFSKEFRDRYAVTISLTTEEIRESHDSSKEKRLVLSIEDRGTGMNEQIITRYFLQVGRSFYQSNEFKERYCFTPTSRFGVGFLSVFAISNNITVETAKLDEVTGQILGIRLNLREPRRYLLTEPWKSFLERQLGERHGTRIRVVLDSWNEQESVFELISRWCVAVEVPVIVKQAGKEAVINAVPLIDKSVVAMSKVNPKGRFLLRTFPLNSHGVEGQVVVIAYEDEHGEAWCDCWPPDQGLDGVREDRLPEPGLGYAAFHGVSLQGRARWHHAEQWFSRSDLRSAAENISMERSTLRRRFPLRTHSSSHEEHGSPHASVLAVQEAARLAVEGHIQESPRAKDNQAARYIGRVLSIAPVANSWRDNFPGLVTVWQAGKRADISVSELLALPELAFALWAEEYYLRREQVRPPIKRHPKDVRCPVPVVSWSDTPQFSDARFAEKLRAMNICAAEEHEDLWLFTFSSKRSSAGFERAQAQGSPWVAPLSLDNSSGVRLQPLGSAGDYFTILDSKSPLVEWLTRLRTAAKSQPRAISPAAVEACWLTAAKRPWEMSNILSRWEMDSHVPAELKPPKDDKRNPSGYTIIRELTSRPTR